jgi:hypothetical protein
LPPFSVLVADLPATKPQIAKHLGISAATLTRYIKTDCAPRAVMLAIFWETRWGRSAADTEASNFSALCQRETNGLKEHARRTAGIIWRLEMDLSRHGAPGAAANLPVFRVG